MMDFEGLIQESKPQKNPYRVAGFSFGYREEPEKLPTIPGPGTYDTATKISKNDGIGFGHSPRFDSKVLTGVVPGPGAYYKDSLSAIVNGEMGSPKNSPMKSPKTHGTFSKAQRMGLFNSTSPLTGPGQYGVKRDFEVLPKERKVSKAKQDKGADGDKSNFYHITDTPGPGQYDVSNVVTSTQKHAAGYSLPKSNRSFANVKQLAEQGLNGDAYRYNKHEEIGKEGPKFSFGSGKRSELSPQTHSPGPFSYFMEFKDPRDKYMTRGTFSQAPRVVGEMKKVELGPSPAEYEYDIGNFKKGTKMAKSPKGPNDEPMSPGPGAYDILDEFNAKKRELEKKLHLQQSVILARSPKNMTETEEGQGFSDKVGHFTEPTSPKDRSPKRGPTKAMWVEDIIKKSVSPGPAYMVQTENIELAHSGAKFATESRPDFVIEEIKKDVPGPGRYEFKVIDAQSTQPVKFPGSKRKDNPVLEEYTLEIPGPEKYDPVKIAARSIYGGGFGRSIRGLGFEEKSPRDSSKPKKRGLNTIEEPEPKKKEKEK